MMVTFKSDISKRKRFFTAESFSHPAKAHLGMMLWIIGKFTKPGETILDPMFGAGSTMLACRYGRNVIGVELEQKFVDIAKGNWDKVKSLPKTKFGLGECVIVQGDARDLEGLLVDSVITSPPYEGSLQGDIEDKISSGFNSPQAVKMIQSQARGYSKEANNIGNLRSDTYLEAMLKVYQQCYKVLKPNGLMILVTKDFIRKGQRILLSIDTIKICEQAGFVYEDWHQRKLTQQSFWRTLYQQKHPEVEKLDTEDILVFRKPSGEGVVDVVVTSPPYAETLEKPLKEGQSRGIRGHSRAKVASNTFWEGGYSHNPNNLGVLPYGLVDTPYDGAKVNDEWIKSRQVNN